MFSSNRIFSVFIVLVLSATACGITPSIPTLDPSAISTLIQGTVNAALTQSAIPAIPTITPSETGTPTYTLTPEPPTLTPTSTLTPIPTFTFTPLVPLIGVSLPTNCRNGPGKVYGYEGALLVGEISEVIARDPTGNYWYIRNPDSAGDYCWLWGRYATITGNTLILPVYTPPPTPSPTFTPKPTLTSTPSPNFKASYTSLDTCTGWWVEVSLKNTGSITFRSVGITVKDTVTDITISNLTDGFTDINGCLTTTTKDVLEPDKTYVISAPAFTYNPTGHLLRATITLCSNTGQNGTCVTKKIEFTP
jgi:hypothetical protein